MSEYIVDFPSNEINDLVMHERIVRCKDCKHFSNWDGFNEFPSCVRHRIAVEPDGFCAWGEKWT